MPYISTTSSPIIPRVNLTIPQNIIKANYILLNPPCSHQPITNDPATLPTSWVHRSGRAGLLELLVLVPALPCWKGPPWCLLVQFWENSLETAQTLSILKPPISSAQPLSHLVAGQCPAILCFLQTDTQIRVHCVNPTYDLYTNKEYSPCFPPMFAFFWESGVIWVILQAPKNLALGAVGSSSNFGGVLASLLAS